MPMLRISRVVLLASLSLLAACAAAPADATSDTTAGLGAAAAASSSSAALTFSGSWTTTASQPLTAGQPVSIAYDPSRLVSKCGGSVSSGGGNGGYAWQIWGYYTQGGAAPVAFPVAITSGWANGNASITPAVAGDLALWFGCGSTSGNTGWDSAYGQNYHFAVAPAAVDAGAGNGIVEVQVVADAVVGSAGNLPADTLSATPIAGVSIYDGPWEAGRSIGTTDASGSFTATLPLGAHQVGVMMMTSSHSLLSSDGNAVTVTSAPGKLVIHVAPTEVQILASYDAGMGNALYVTGETSYLGSWTTAYKLAYEGNGTWMFTKNLPMGAQFKIILAPWTSGDSISVSAPGVRWAKGQNGVVTPPFQSYMTTLNVTPSF